MRIEQLEYLDVVVRAGSMTRASEELHLSPSGLSETIRNLERELGTSLLTRGKGGAVLNDAGREVMPRVRAVLDAVAELRESASLEGRRGIRKLRLGTVNAATASLLAPSVQEFRTAHPDIAVDVIGSQPRDIEHALLEGRLDLGLVTMLEGDAVPEGLETEDVLDGDVLVCLPPEHPLADRLEITVEELRAHPAVALRPGYLMSRLTLAIMDGRPSDLQFHADSAEMAKFMVAEGLGPALLPDFCVVGDPLHRRGGIVCRPLAGPRRVVGLRLLRTRAATPAGPVVELAAILRRRGHDLLAEAETVTAPVLPGGSLPTSADR
jgi:DNA-binding transcriptional LysR family regulator